MAEAIIGLLGVIVGAVMIAAKDIWLEWRKKEESARFLAIRVVSAFDRFVRGCADVVDDDGLLCGQPDPDGLRQKRVPEPRFDVQDFDVNWKSIPAPVMYDILSFPNLVEAARHRIVGAFEHGDGPPDYQDGFQERQYEFAELGLRASEIADCLRESYGVPRIEHGDWDPVVNLKEAKQRIETFRAKRHERNQKLWASIPGNGA